MANSAQFYEQMAARTAEQITGSYQEWTAFLATAARAKSRAPARAS